MSLTFWKPGTVGPGSTLDRASELEETVVPYAPSNSYLSIQSQQERLPIFKHRKPNAHTYHLSEPPAGENLLYCIEKYGVVIVVGQTGCGKTTRKLANCFKECIISSFKNFRNTSFRVVGLPMAMSSHVRNLEEYQPLLLLLVWLMRLEANWEMRYFQQLDINVV